MSGISFANKLAELESSKNIDAAAAMYAEGILNNLKAAEEWAENNEAISTSTFINDVLRRCGLQLAATTSGDASSSLKREVKKAQKQRKPVDRAHDADVINQACEAGAKAVEEAKSEV